MFPICLHRKHSLFTSENYIIPRITKSSYPAKKIFFIILGQGSKDPCPPPISGINFCPADRRDFFISGRQRENSLLRLKVCPPPQAGGKSSFPL
ncbi:hypothetical protein HMPREF1986_01034 [Oribacterium sp. oral taxon 078 str. F0263]|nr:hypothetical protein HMPREF1986_01034 [Oribacterium sp. oral taxon 078 str. F0263]